MGFMGWIEQFLLSLNGMKASSFIPDIGLQLLLQHVFS